MSLSAVSAFLALVALDVPKQSLTAPELRVWSKVRSSVVTLMQNGAPRGLGICVDKKGYFLAHKSACPSSILFGKLSSGPQIELRQVAMDEPTQLVLLYSPTLAEGVVSAVSLGAEPEKSGGTLLAILTTGPLRAEFVSGERFGVVNPSRRLVPLNELRFEAASSQIGGGLVFNLDGSLLGVLGATLGMGETNRAEFQNPAKALDASPPGTRSGLGGGGGLALPLPSIPVKQFGPAPQTVAYSVSSSVLQRVVGGLLSPTRKVLHPAIGVFCKDGAEPGAEVASIQAGSPAERAGIQPGDIITSIGDAPVRNQVDVARITMRLRIGTTIDVKLKRDGEEMTVKVAVGAS